MNWKERYKNKQASPDGTTWGNLAILAPAAIGAAGYIAHNELNHCDYPGCTSPTVAHTEGKSLKRKIFNEPQRCEEHYPKHSK